MKFIRQHPTLIWGIGITAFFLIVATVRVGFLDALELKFYDFRLGLLDTAGTADPLVIVDIDDASIEKLGRWPWPRSIVAECIRKIDAGNPKVIGLNIIYSEPEDNSGLRELLQLEQIFTQTGLTDASEDARAFLVDMQSAVERLDNDAKLTQAISDARKVVLPVFFLSRGFEEVDAAPPDNILASNAIFTVQDPEKIGAPGMTDIILPIRPFFEKATGIGHINFACDMDGITRREQLLFEYRNFYFPAYTLALAARYLGLPPEQISATLGHSVSLGALTIPVTQNSEMLVGFKGGRGSFKHFSFFDVLNDKIPRSVFKNKLVLVSTSATGILNPLSVPTDPSLTVGEFTANAIWTILNKRFIQQPAWCGAWEFALILLIALLLIIALPRLKAALAGFVFLAVLLLFAGGATYAFVAGRVWLQTTYPALLLIIGYIGLVSIQFFVTETRKEQVEGESAETNRMLGLSFQSQGMLDMAFDKFRKVPVDKEMKDILYNLGLDYERKRQFNKAAMVYEHIETHDPKYKDAAEKKKKLIRASETMVYGDAFYSGGNSDELLSTASETRPTMGRYEIIKQLGKGAMGVVYLGQDPRINRTTAIKTFRLSDDFEADEIEAMKKKFFREAESAGTLSHPNIVTIYDAGEEHDLAYIAMEYLEGEDLQAYTKKEKLLPVIDVIRYCADIAEGLDYAHGKGIVHRDIKPANIMRLKSGIIKITDFGIARITASSQTRTGVVKGTPYYMSPEQISGQKVDGRSDIFSLGVMMFQMLTGTVPFDGDSPASLMHRILNERQPDPRTINPKIPKLLVQILEKALAKNPDHRYQEAKQMGRHLKLLAKKMESVMK